VVCLRGASAVNALVAQHPKADVRIFVVWEPILPMDVAPPLTMVLRRMSDRRVQQYWDPDHVVAKQMAKDARAPQPAHDCCERSGILWDLAAVYPRGATWSDRMPPALMFNGPVVDVTSEIQSALERAAALPAPVLHLP
jgi:hypothetical protein